MRWLTVKKSEISSWVGCKWWQYCSKKKKLTNLDLVLIFNISSLQRVLNVKKFLIYRKEASPCLNFLTSSKWHVIYSPSPHVITRWNHIFFCQSLALTLFSRCPQTQHRGNVYRRASFINNKWFFGVALYIILRFSLPPCTFRLAKKKVLMFTF